MEAPETENAIFSFLGRSLDEPFTNSGNSLVDAVLLIHSPPMSQRSNGEIAGRAITGLRWRPMARRAPMILVRVVLQQIFHDGLGRRVGFPAAQFEREQRVPGRFDLTT